MKAEQLAYPTLFSRCPVVVCAAPDGDTGPGSKLFTTVAAAHTRDNTLAVVCDVSTGRIQGSHRGTPKCFEGNVGDVGETGARRNEWNKANAGHETADIPEVFLIMFRLNNDMLKC
jgi:hypothetical protein